MTVRRAAVAGTWYPAAPAVLARQVEAYLDEAGQSRLAESAPPPDADVLSLIAPHAGLMYSGPVAAHAYRLLRTREYDSIVLIGPSHYIGFHGASIWPRGSFETPSGALAIDEDLAAALLSACGVLQERRDAHEREHSLEMQLPFLATLAPSTPIVPIVMGTQTRATAFMLGNALADVSRQRRVLTVASSDLSHFHDAETASALDAQVIDCVDRLDDEGLMTLLETRSDHACGGGPMVSVLRAARLSAAGECRVLRYADSGDVSGDKTSVVGYLAAAAWR